MSFFRREDKPAQLVTTGRFELERDGSVAYLEYSLAGNILALIHTEVPESMRGKGIASELVGSALRWAREHQAKVDVICPIALDYMEKHPEYADLLLR